jgi:antitoxin component of RelBE/YafQ-DinJ toxin-antitoxin module
MEKTILQVPMNQQLKSNAEKAATEQGFSSLQEVVRVFVTNFASHKVEIGLHGSVLLSPKNEKRYLKMTEDFDSGHDTFSADGTTDLVSRLNEDSVS